jgi:hypothetical protein
MAFSGLASNELNTASLIQRSIADLARSLSNKETPLLAWIGDADDPATHIKHEFIEDFMLPNTIVTSTAISSAAVATPIALQVSGPRGLPGHEHRRIGQLDRRLARLQRHDRGGLARRRRHALRRRTGGRGRRRSQRGGHAAARYHAIEHRRAVPLRVGAVEYAIRSEADRQR